MRRVCRLRNAFSTDLPGGEGLPADSALVFRAFLVLLQVLAHDGRCQGDIVALLALRELGVGRRRDPVHGEEVE